VTTFRATTRTIDETLVQDFWRAAHAVCEDLLFGLQELYRTHPRLYQADWFRRVYNHSRCIAIDDPRLQQRTSDLVTSVEPAR
jgi:hypothetical protein